MEVQELVDRLVVAVEEEDLLYVLYWLEQMREQGCLEQGLMNKRELNDPFLLLCF